MKCCAETSRCDRGRFESAVCSLEDGHDNTPDGKRHITEDGYWWEIHRAREIPKEIPKASEVTVLAIVDLVIEDMRKRDRLSTEKYGTRLHVDSERDSLRDAYEGALDLAIYLRQTIERRDRELAKCAAIIGGDYAAQL